MLATDRRTVGSRVAAGASCCRLKSALHPWQDPTNGWAELAYNWLFTILDFCIELVRMTRPMLLRQFTIGS
jgi:hypothetical protein